MSKLAATKNRVDQQLEIFYFHLEKHQFKLQMLSVTEHAQEIKVLDKMMDIVNTILDASVNKIQSKQVCFEIIESIRSLFGCAGTDKYVGRLLFMFTACSRVAG